MNPRGNGGPKMPRFNMTWLFTICLIAMLILFLQGGGDAIGRKRSQGSHLYRIQAICRQGLRAERCSQQDGKYPQNIYQPEIYARCIQYAAQSVGPNPYVKVQFGSVDEVDRYANEMVKEKKIRSFSYDNQKSNDFCKHALQSWHLSSSSYSSSIGCREESAAVWAAAVWAAASSM